MSGERLKRCPRCGTFFTCFGNDDCWCERLQIHKKDLLAIVEKYRDCLCPDCLGEFAERV